MLQRFEQFTASIITITHYIQKIERDEMEKLGLKGAYAQYLLAMREHPQGLTAAQLCEICERNKAAVSRILSELEQRGLVHRSAEAYRAVLTLTDEGRDIADWVSRKAALATELVGQGLNDRDRSTLYAALSLISNNIETVSKTGLPDR